MKKSVLALSVGLAVFGIGIGIGMRTAIAADVAKID